SYLYYIFHVSVGFYQYSIELGTYAYLLLLIVSITYRIVPFFTGRIIPDYVPRRGRYTLEILLAFILLRFVEPNPWDELEGKYPVGTRIKGEIKNITDFGIFVGIEEGIDGLVHISDISWTKKVKHPSDLYKKADVIETVVLNVDKKNERFSLGVKQ